MEENTMREVSKAIEIMEALKDVKRIAQEEIDVCCGEGLYYKGYGSHACITSGNEKAMKSALKNNQIIEIVNGIIEQNPHDGDSIYKRIYGLVRC